MYTRRVLKLLRRQFDQQRLCIRHSSNEDHLPKINVNMLSQTESSSIYIQGYNKLGFKLKKGMTILGPCVFFSQTVLHWNVEGPHDIDENSLSLFTMLEPKLDLLILGVGSDISKFNHQMRRYLLSHKIKTEVLTTPQACEMFNFVNSEDRFVAAALIPPQKMISAVQRDEGLSHNVTLDLQYGMDTYLAQNEEEDKLLNEKKVLKKISWRKEGQARTNKDDIKSEKDEPEGSKK